MKMSIERQIQEMIESLEFMELLGSENIAVTQHFNEGNEKQ